MMKMSWVFKLQYTFRRIDVHTVCNQITSDKTYEQTFMMYSNFLPQYPLKSINRHATPISCASARLVSYLPFYDGISNLIFLPLSLCVMALVSLTINTLPIMICIRRPTIDRNLLIIVHTAPNSVEKKDHCGVF